jgi:hypothetical protein
LTNYIIILFAVISFCSCKNNIETGATLSKQDVQFIQKLGLLDKNERIFKFYSEFKKSVAGNFYSNIRLASYWLDKQDSTKNKIEFAFYNDIIKIDTIYNAGATYCPFLLVTRRDGSNFKVCVDGKKEEITAFFNEALNKWKQNQSKQ